MLKDETAAKKLWDLTKSLRDSFSSEEDMLMIIGIFLLKYISERFTKVEKRIKHKFPDNWKNLISKGTTLDKYGFPFFLPEEAKWSHITKYASSDEIGSKLNNAFSLLEKTNKNLEGLLTDQDYKNPNLKQKKLQKLITEFSNHFDSDNTKNNLAQTYEYFLGKFFEEQTNQAKEFYTPKTIVELLVNLIEPHDDAKVYDPAFGTGGMFIQSNNYIYTKENNSFFTFYGQERSKNRWKLGYINLIINEIEPADIKIDTQPTDTFIDDYYPNETFDFIFCDPPFNDKNWGYDKLQRDSRWKWGEPPEKNANYAWLSNILAKLKNQGRAGVVLAFKSLDSVTKEEKRIRKSFLRDNKIKAIVSLPPKLFPKSGASACLWIFDNAKKTTDILMVHANDFKCEKINGNLQKFRTEEIKKIKDVFSRFDQGEVINEKEFARSVSRDEINKSDDFSLCPGPYIASTCSKPDLIDVKNLKKQIKSLSQEIKQTFSSIKNLEQQIEKNINEIVEK